MNTPANNNKSNNEKITDHGGKEVSGHRVPQDAASETAKRTSVSEPARSPQDAVPCDRLPEKLYLRGRQARELRARGHHLQPKVMVGREGSGPAVVDALEGVFCAHELVKIKLQESCPEDKTAVAHHLATATSSRIVQIIGRTILLYREIPSGDEKKQEKDRSAAKNTGRGGGKAKAKTRAGARGRSKTATGKKTTGKIRSLACRR